MKTKSILIIILVFIAGGVAGAFIAGQTYKHRIHRIKEHRKPEVFREHMHDVLETTDAQRQAIDSVFEEYLPRIQELRKHNWEEIKVLHDSMLTNVRTHLHDHQIEKLEKFERRFMKHKKHRHK